MKFRWISEDALYHPETDNMLPGVMKALYVASRKISLTIQCESVDTTKLRLNAHDTLFKKVAENAADDLYGTMEWDKARRRTFYRQIARSGAVADRLGFSNNANLPTSSQIDADGLREMVSSWLRDTEDA